MGAAVSVSESFGELAANIVVRTSASATTPFDSTSTSRAAVTNSCSDQPASEGMAEQTEEAKKFQ